MIQLLMKIFKNMLQVIKENLETIYLISISFLWIGVFIYFRFFQKKSTYSLTELKYHITDYILYINSLFILIHILLLCYAIYNIFIKGEKKSTKKMVQLVKNIVNILFIKPLIKLQELIAPHIPGSGIFFCKITEFFEKKDLSLLKYPVIIFNFSPRIIVSLMFFAELIFFNQIHYFIYSISLLFVSLFWNIFLSLYISFAERVLREIPKYIKIIPVGQRLANGWYSQYDFEPLDKYEYVAGEVQEYGETYIVGGMHTYSFGAGTISFKSFQQKFSPYVILFTSSLYLSAGLYKLIYILS